jgi:tRNA threonylcarbamoyladenosine modification (KEOPS) complex Cgi121 subunit
MRFYMAEFGKTVEITGYRGITFLKAEAFLKANRKQTQTADIQFFDAKTIATPQHLYFAAQNALQAFKDKTNISKTPAVETILYASAQRQIKKAIDRCGIKPETTNMATIIIGDDPQKIAVLLQEVSAWVGLKPDEDVLEMTKDKLEKIREAFEITDKEIETVTKGNVDRALVDLVIEQVALLATQL